VKLELNQNVWTNGLSDSRLKLCAGKSLPSDDWGFLRRFLITKKSKNELITK
jgi:hypothetical protein